LKNAKKLKGKTLSSFSHVYIGVDAPPEVRKMCKNLHAKKAKLREHGFETWVYKSFPLILHFNCPNGTHAKYLWTDPVSELALPQNYYLRFSVANKVVPHIEHNLAGATEGQFDTQNESME